MTTGVVPEKCTRGILVAVEGIDGAGKTTQVRMLKRALMRAGQSVTASREPTNGQWGSILRRSAKGGRLSIDDELQTFIKDRTEHVQNLISPRLDAGDIVILDRYFYSTIAYQGARGADIASISVEMLSRFPEPDTVFLLDVDPVVGIHRIANDRGEEPNLFEDRASLGQAREIFNKMKDGNVHRVNGLLSVDEVHRKIIGLFVDGPLKAKRCAKEWWSIKDKISAEERGG